MEAGTIMAEYAVDVRRSARGRAALDRSEVAGGARAVLPIAVAATAFGVSYGILAREAGMGIAAPIVMSFTTFAGSAQFASALSLIHI